jgi:ribulose-phosphate 3-epimerase
MMGSAQCKEIHVGISKIAPSMMCADFLDLKRVVDIFIEEQIDYLHIDIMDGHYAPNFTLGIGFCKSLYEYTDIPLDIHLMIDNPDEHIDTFSPFTGSVLSFHPEISPQPSATLQRIKDSGLRPGLVLKPDLPLEWVKPFLSGVEFLNVMTVHPGYAGQSLVPGTIEKLAEVVAWVERAGLHVEIEVDGNVSWKNIPKMFDAGAMVFVAGTSSIFSGHGSLQANIGHFRQLLSAHS